MNKKEVLNEKYNLAFNNEYFDLVYDLYQKIEKKVNNFNLIVFFSSVIILIILLNAENFLVQNHNEKIFTILLYGMFIPLIYSAWNMLFYKLSLESEVIEIIDSELYNEIKSKKSQIENYYFDKNNIEKIISCMNYCKVEFNTNFAIVESRISTVDLSELLLKSFKNKDLSEIINQSIEVKKNIEKVLNDSTIKAVTY